MRTDDKWFYQEGHMKWLLWPLVIAIITCGLWLVAYFRGYSLNNYEFQGMTALAVLFTVLAAEPFIRFLDVGWFVRYDEFKNSMTHDALRAYLRKFWGRRSNEYIKKLNGPKGRANKQLHVLEDLDDERTVRIFDQIYKDQYGIGAFIAPLLLLVFVVFLEALLVFYLKDVKETPVFGVDTKVVISSVAGAYLFSVGDAVLSVRKRSLNISDIYWYDLRLAIAIPIGIAFGSASGISGDSHPGIAFAIGALPVDVLIKTIRRVALTALAPGEKTQVETDQLITLQGVTVATSGLLSAEGVTSIGQLTSMDPILVAIRTGLPFGLILFLGSQAVVRQRFGGNSQKLEDFGLVDAESIALLVNRIETTQLPNPTTSDQPEVIEMIDASQTPAAKDSAPPATMEAVAVNQGLIGFLSSDDAHTILISLTQYLFTDGGMPSASRIRATYYQLQLIAADPYTRFLIQVRGMEIYEAMARQK